MPGTRGFAGEFSEELQLDVGQRMQEPVLGVGMKRSWEFPTSPLRTALSCFPHSWGQQDGGTVMGTMWGPQRPLWGPAVVAAVSLQEQEEGME